MRQVPTAVAKSWPTPSARDRQMSCFVAFGPGMSFFGAYIPSNAFLGDEFACGFNGAGDCGEIAVGAHVIAKNDGRVAPIGAREALISPRLVGWMSAGATVKASFLRAALRNRASGFLASQSETVRAPSLMSAR